MLRFFRVNDPYRLVFVFLILVLLRVIQSFFIQGTGFFELKWLLLGQWLAQGYNLYSETFDYTGPLAALIYKGFALLFGTSKWVHVVLSSLNIVIQAAIFNRLLIRNKAFEELNYIPALVYMLFMVSITDFMMLSPQAMSLTCLLLVLQNVVRKVDNKSSDELMLSCGIYLGIATLLYPQTCVFAIIFLISIVAYSPTLARRIFLYFVGFSLIISLALFYYTWEGRYQVAVLSLSYGFINRDLVGTFWELLPYLSLWIPIVVIAAVRTFMVAKQTIFQHRILQIIRYFALGGLVILIISYQTSVYDLVFFIPFMTYFITHHLYTVERRVFKLLIPVVFLLGPFIFSIVWYRHANEIYLQERAAVEQGTLILSDFTSYRNGNIYTPTFDRGLSESAFNRIDYYASAEQLYDLLEKIDPQVIVDDLGVMNSVLERYHVLNKKYQQVGPDTYRRTTN